MVMVGHLIRCKECGKELQPEDILIGMEEGNLISKCNFCGGEISKK